MTSATAPETNSGEHRAEATRPPRPTSWFWTFVVWNQVFWCLFLGSFPTIIIGGIAWLFGDRHRRVASAIVTWSFRCIGHPLFMHRVRVTGLENVPDGGCIFCPNHQSHADLVFIYRMPLHFRVITKRQLAAIPLVGTAIRMAGYPIIDRGDVDSAMTLIDQCRGYLDAGIPVLTFPEGTRSLDGEVKRFSSGAARLAVATGKPLVPIGVAGSAHMLPAKQLMFSAGSRARIHIGEPIPVDGLEPRDVRALTRKLRAAIVEARKEAAKDADAP